MAYKTRTNGAPNSLEYSLYLENQKGELISPFHDIPLFADEAKGIFNMVVEIPRWSNAKLEINKAHPFNPIKQDVKKGQLRFVKNCFPHHGYIWNYGAFPQTWEDPTHIDADTKSGGDNDPLDVCEIGFSVAKSGAVKQVKILGAMALLDEGETDWKIIAIDVTDPLANELNDIEDVERKLPGFLKATEEWFRIYKIPDGKPENKFAFNGEAKNKDYALRVVKETHEAWKKLITKAIPNKTEKYDIQTVNTQVSDSPYKVAADSDAVKAIPPHEDKPGNPIDPSVDKWYFVATL
jgi:inorganic pyrophosphatase